MVPDRGESPYGMTVEIRMLVEDAPEEPIGTW
jgi:hypothetical protein